MKFSKHRNFSYIYNTIKDKNRFASERQFCLDFNEKHQNFATGNENRSTGKRVK